MGHEALLADGPVLGTLHVYPGREDEGLDEDDLDPDAARATLKRHAALAGVVHIRIAPDPSASWNGFVVGIGAEWVLVHAIANEMFMNGYCAFRVSDVRAVDALDPDESFLPRSLDLLALRPVSQPDVRLDDARTLLESVQDRLPVVALFLDWTDPGVCYIGRATADEEAVELRHLTPAARWADTDVYRAEDISRIEFGDAYMHALALAAETD